MDYEFTENDFELLREFNEAAHDLELNLEQNMHFSACADAPRYDAVEFSDEDFELLREFNEVAHDLELNLEQNIHFSADVPRFDAVEFSDEDFELFRELNQAEHDVERVCENPSVELINQETTFVDLLGQVFEDAEFRALFDNVKRQCEDDLVGFGIKKQKLDDKPYTLQTTSTKQNKKFKWTEKVYNLDLHIDREMTFAEALEFLKDMFEQLHKDFVQPVSPNDKVKLVFEHDQLKDTVWFPYMSPADLTPDLILNTFDRIVQSYKLTSEIMQPRNKFTAKVMVVEMPSGSGSLYGAPIPWDQSNDFDRFLFKSKSIKVILNTDELCLLRAIIVALACDSKEKDVRNLVARPNSKEFKRRLDQLCNATQIFSGPCGVEHIKIVEDYLKEYQIMVINGNGKINKEPIYLNRNREFNKYLYLCLYRNHYFVVTSMRVFLNVDYYCDKCKIGFNEVGKHTCTQTCGSCLRLNCDHQDSTLHNLCNGCAKTCFNTTCTRMHQETFCPKVAFCQTCRKRKLRNHVCVDQKWCANCRKAVEMDHRCYILTEAEKAKRDEKMWKSKFKGYIFFDYEAFQNSEGNHVPNLIVAKRVCTSCVDGETRCIECQPTFKFYNNNDFCAWLFKHEYYTAMAHNLKGYDGVFIANYCINNLTSSDSFPEMIATPTKLLQIKFKKLTIIDSYSFMAMALEKFPGTFEIPELKKGFYPHLFNKPENSNYVGPYPPKEDYGYEFFSITKKEQFDEFYSANAGKDFNNQQELEDYCISDVEILMEGCLKFRKIILEQTKLSDNDQGVDPFRVSITIASLCNYIYRRNFMKPKTIAIIPENGNPKQNTSNKCKQ